VTCPLCREPVRPGEPVALVTHGDRVRVIHLVPCGGVLLALDDALRTAALLATAEALGTLPTPNQVGPPARRASSRHAAKVGPAALIVLSNYAQRAPIMKEDRHDRAAGRL
jgi:hypothetical protein